VCYSDISLCVVCVTVTVLCCMSFSKSVGGISKLCDSLGDVHSLAYLLHSGSVTGTPTMNLNPQPQLTYEERGGGAIHGPVILAC